MRAVFFLSVLLASTARAQAPVDTIRNVAATPAAFLTLCPRPAVTAETGYDLALRGTGIQAHRALQLVPRAFDTVQEAPREGFLRATPDGPAALPAGMGNSWYGYNPDEHIVFPLGARTIFVETTAGRTAKVEVLSYYHSGTGEPRFYTLRVACAAPDGTF